MKNDFTFFIVLRVWPELSSFMFHLSGWREKGFWYEKKCERDFFFI